MISLVYLVKAVRISAEVPSPSQRGAATLLSIKAIFANVSEPTLRTGEAPWGRKAVTEHRTTGGRTPGPGDSEGSNDMKCSYRAALAATAVTTMMMLGSTAQAGPITRACLASDSRAASPALCGCIQQVADMVLSNRDQRQAARFFKKPDMAQDVKMSSSRSDEQFWEKYSYFGAVAQEQCAAS